MIAQLTEVTASAYAAGHSVAHPLVTMCWVDQLGRRIDEPIAPIGNGSVRVSLRDGTGAEVARTITDADGNFSFDQLPGGDLALVFTLTGSADGEEFGELPPRPPVLTWSGGPGQLRLAGTIS